MQQQHTHELAVAHRVHRVDDDLVKLGVFRDLGRRLQRLRPLLPSVERQWEGRQGSGGFVGMFIITMQLYETQPSVILQPGLNCIHVLVVTVK